MEFFFFLATIRPYAKQINHKKEDVDLVAEEILSRLRRGRRCAPEEVGVRLRGARRVVDVVRVVVEDALEALVLEGLLGEHLCCDLREILVVT